MLKREAKSQNCNGLPTKVISIHHPFHFYLLSSPPLFLFLFTLCALLISVPPPTQGLPWQLRCSRICLQCRRPCFNSWVRKIFWRRDRLPTPVFLGFPCGSVSKESACNVGDLGWEDPLEKGTATHSGILAWRIPWNVQQCMGSQRVRHD